MLNYQKMIIDALTKVNDKYQILNKISEQLSKYPKLDKINAKLSKHIKKNNPVKVKPETIYNHEPVESSMAVKLLKKKFESALKGEENNILTKEADLYTSLLNFINSQKESRIFPSSSDIENYLNIGKRKRQDLLKQLFDNGEIIKVNPTTYGFKEV